jgi:hypothetical protein
LHAANLVSTFVVQRRHHASIGQRLRRLDERFAPDRSRGKYDTQVPLWLAYGSMVGSASVIGLGTR